MRKVKQIDKFHSFFIGNLTGNLSVLGQALVVGRTVRQIGLAKVLVGNRREEHDGRGALIIVFLAICFIDPLGQVGAVCVRAVVERLVVTPERKDHIRLGNLEIRVGTREPAVARPVVHLVTAEALIAEHQFLVGHCGLRVALEPAVVLHALRERVANEDDMVALV